MTEAQSKLRDLVQTRIDYINSHKEELLEAFIAKTGKQPDEIALCVQGSLLEGIELTWIEIPERKK